MVCAAIGALSLPQSAGADTVDGLFNGSGALAGGSTYELSVLGRGGVHQHESEQSAGGKKGRALRAGNEAGDDENLVAKLLVRLCAQL